MTDAELRDLLRQRRDRVVREWDLQRGSVVIPAGLAPPIAGTDQEHDFHAEPEHHYLSGSRREGGVLTFDPEEGWTLFAYQRPLEERVWMNTSDALEVQAAETGIDEVRERSALAAWLERRRGEPLAVIGNHDIEQRSTDYGVPSWVALELTVDEELSARLSQVVAETRRAKDPEELAWMRAAAAASIDGHRSGIALARAGMSERELQIEIEASFFRSGGERTAYGSIVGGGRNAATLHFAPTGRRFAEGDLILVDAGAEVGGYASDVTRSYPVSGTFTPAQRDIYALVLRTQQAAMAAARPGVEYKELHLAAALEIASGLVDLGILRGDPQSLVDQDAHALFFPHGLGHLLGLSTHDAGGCLAGREPSERFGLNYLRADLPLEEGYVVTIEPGIYFIEALLTDPARRERYREAVDWGRVDGMLEFGGIRIEDDVLITEDGVENLSGALPSELAAIEALRQEALER